MRIDLHIHVHLDPAFAEALQKLAPGPTPPAPAPEERAVLDRLETNVEKTNEALAALAASVEREETVVDGAVALIASLPATIKAVAQEALERAGVDDDTAAEAVIAVNDKVTAFTDRLRDALAAGTGEELPPAPAPPPIPPTDTISGGAGDDSVGAGGGEDTTTADTLAGGSGDDTISGGDDITADTTAGGAGEDTVAGAAGADEGLPAGGADQVHEDGVSTPVAGSEDASLGTPET